MKRPSRHGKDGRVKEDGHGPSPSEGGKGPVEVRPFLMGTMWAEVRPTVSQRL